MLLDFFNLKRPPFGVAPDPKSLFLSETHGEALASLIYGVREERGFIALVAPPGMGKTTLLFRFLESLRDTARTVFLFQTQCGTIDFFRYLIRDLGLSPAPDLPSMHEQLNQVLLDEQRQGRRFVLVIDEAQGLEASVLETVRLLSDFEVPGRKLLQIILAGQPSLATTLMRPDLEQLRQRISIVASLRPFDAQQVSDYISFRLRAAGHHGDPLFTREAVQMIAESSEGIPRQINNLCFNALSIAFALGKKPIDLAIIREASADLSIESPASGRGGAAQPTEDRGSSGFVPNLLLVGPRRKFSTVAVAGIAAVAAMLTIASFVGDSSANQPAKTAAVLARRSPIVDERRGPSIRPSEISVERNASVVVVGPGQTLRDISTRHRGVYSPKTSAARPKNVNPTLHGADLIEAGAEGRFPLPESGSAGQFDLLPPIEEQR